MNYIAHIRESDKHIQTVEEHLLEVQRLSESYGDPIGAKHITGLAGMLHDLGKYTDQFRDYLLKAVYEPESAPKRGSVDHSTAGGKLLYELFHTDPIHRWKGILAEVVGNAIISHHSYLQDYINPKLESNYLLRVRDKQLDEFDKTVEHFYQRVMDKSSFQQYVNRAAAELECFLQKETSTSSETKLAFLTKFIYSCLVDADRTDTRLFEENAIKEAQVDSVELFSRYYGRLMARIESFKEPPNANSPINRLRMQMSDRCEQFAEKPSGIYTLSIPTGGGKTLASLRYALKHAITFGKKRIIYIVPYTTIIEQNAEEVRKILCDDANILEHHSNVIEEYEDDDEHEDGWINTRQKLKLAKDNWDCPIIFTTMVQFLNVFYATGSRNSRRMHHLSESVLIFDEVQKVPIPCVSLFNQAVNFLKTYGKSSVVLCTATQPELDYVKYRLELEPEAEMIENLDDVVHAFKRVELIDKATDQFLTNEQLADFIVQKFDDVQSVLVILNTKSVVQQLYLLLKKKNIAVPIYHLSTAMCAAHRKNILEEVRDHLSHKQPIICLSTQLIEAGVDVSFECVIRSLAGLDSMAQAAGRCNRHGEAEIRQVYLIDHQQENLSRLKEIKEGKEIARKMLIDLSRNPAAHGGHLLSVEAMQEYFQRLYTAFESDLHYYIPEVEKFMTDLLFAGKDKKDSLYADYCYKYKKRLPLFLANSYRTAAEHFRVIDQQTTSVIVPYGEGKEIIAQLNGQRSIQDLSRLLRTAQQYTINLFPYEKEHLIRNDGLVSYLDGMVWALKEGAYDQKLGLQLDSDGQFEAAIF